MTRAPAISVVIPTYDRPEALDRALGALARQDHAEFEVIVVDDGGRRALDGLRSRHDAHLDLVLLRQANAGPAAARNFGASRARGDLLAFLDDDCAPRPDWLRRIGEAVAQAGPPRLVGGRTLNALAGNVFSQASQDIVDHLSRVAGAPFAASNNIAVPRRAFEMIGGFDAAYPLAAGEDRAFCRAWTRRGWPIVRAEDALVEHHHDLDIRSFWRQHLAYGRGARRYHASGGDVAFNPFRRLGFYGGLVASPFSARPRGGSAMRAALIGLAQVATLAGFVMEARLSGAAEAIAAPAGLREEEPR